MTVMMILGGMLGWVAHMGKSMVMMMIGRLVWSVGRFMKVMMVVAVMVAAVVVMDKWLRWLAQTCRRLLKLGLAKCAGPYFVPDLNADRFDFHILCCAAHFHNILLNVDAINEKFCSYAFALKNGSIKRLTVKFWPRFAFEVEGVELRLVPQTARKEGRPPAPHKASYEPQQMHLEKEGLSPMPWAGDTFQQFAQSGVNMLVDLLKRYCFGAPFILNQLSVAIEELTMHNKSLPEAHKQSMLLFRISHVLSIVQNSEAMGGDGLGVTPFHVTNKVSFQQMCLEMVNYSDDCRDLRATQGCNQSLYEPPISFMENDSGLSGHFKVSINEKSGHSELPKVDVAIDLEPIKLHFKDTQSQQLMNLTTSFLNSFRVEEFAGCSCERAPRSPTRRTVPVESTFQPGSKGSRVVLPAFCSLCFFKSLSCLPVLSGLSIIAASFRQVPLAIRARIAEVSAVLDEDGFKAHATEAAFAGIDLFWQVDLEWQLLLKQIDLYQRQYPQQGDSLTHELDGGSSCNFYAKPACLSADSLQALAELSVPEFPVFLSKESYAPRRASDAGSRKCILRISGQGHLSGLQVRVRHSFSRKRSGKERAHEREERSEYEFLLQPLALWEDGLLIHTVQHWLKSFGCVAKEDNGSMNGGIVSPTCSSAIARKIKVKLCFSCMRVWARSPQSSAIWNDHLLCLDMPVITVGLMFSGSTAGEGNGVCLRFASLALAERSNIYMVSPFIQRSVFGQNSAVRCHMGRALSISFGSEPATVQVFCRPKADEGFYLAELAWTAIARQQERGPGSWDTAVGQGLMDKSNRRLREDISLFSSTSFLVDVPKAKVELLALHIRPIVEILSSLCHTVVAASKRMTEQCPSHQREIDQMSISLDVRDAELVLHPDIESHTPSKMKTWNKFVIGIMKFQMLHAVRLGMLSNASYFWVHHGDGCVKGSLLDADNGSTEVQLLTLTDDVRDWVSGGGSGDENASTTSSAGLELSVVSWAGRPDTADMLIHGVLDGCTLMAHAGNLDLLQCLMASLSQLETVIADATRDHGFLSRIESSIDARYEADGRKRANEHTDFFLNNDVLFSIKLHNAALCYNPSLAALCSSKNISVKFDPVSCLLVAASVSVSNCLTSNTASEEYEVALRDIALLVANDSSTPTMRTDGSGLRTKSMHLADCVEVAGVANMGVVVGTDISNYYGDEPNWKIVSTGGQLQIDTDISTAAALSRLFAHLQLLFGHEMEQFASTNDGGREGEDCGLNVCNGHTIGKLVFKNWQVRWRIYEGLHWPISLRKYPRQTDLCMEMFVNGVTLQHDMYPIPASSSSRSVLVIEELGIYDCSKDAPWKKVLGGHLSTSAQVWKVELETVRSNPSVSAEEYWLSVQPSPMRVRIGHWHMDFLSKFINGLDFVGGTSDRPLPVFQTVEVHPCRIQVDYFPCKLEEMKGLLDSEDRTKLLNQIAFKYMDLELKQVRETQVHGWQTLFSTVTDQWWEDIMHNQTSNLLKGVGPIRSLLALGSAAAELVRMPVALGSAAAELVRMPVYECQQRAPREGMAPLEGMSRGVRGIFQEAVVGGVQMAAGAEEFLSRAGSALGSSSGSGLGAGQGQPWSAQEGTQKALERLCRGWERAESELIQEPREAFRKSGKKRAALKGFLRAAPGVAMASLGDGVGAVHLYLRGVRNELDPWRRLEFEDKHSLPPPRFTNE